MGRHEQVDLPNSSLVRSQVSYWYAAPDCCHAHAIETMTGGLKGLIIKPWKNIKTFRRCYNEHDSHVL